jgi:purine-binding chemotaxis protein CheW
MESVNHDIQLAGISLGENLFAVDIMRIKEIILPQKPSPLPGGSQLLEGVINLRGSVIPVMDLRKRLGLPPSNAVSAGKFLVVSLARQTLALAVDNVLDVITLPAREILPVPDTAECVGPDFLLGVCLCDDRVFMILDIDSLLGQPDFRPDTPEHEMNDLVRNQPLALEKGPA